MGIGEIDGWSAAPLDSAGDGFRLAQLVTKEVRKHGRHLLGDQLLETLAEIQHRRGNRDPFLHAFLDAILARHQDRFRNQTYLALPLLDQVLADPRSGLDPERLSALLIADIVAHESQPSSAGRTDPETRRKRITHAKRLLTALGSADITDLPLPPRTAAGAWLPLTVLPVSLVHDEYFFIRALQTHELVFRTLTADVQAATHALRAGQVDAATAALLRADKVFQRAAMLFRIVATMRADQFHDFRQFTEGASAIQSESYKRFEVCCGEPKPSRIRSEAFTNVPAVQAGAHRQDNVARAFLDLHRQGRIDDSAGTRLRFAIDQLEASHQRWKITHYRLAARMLGNAHGSGYTAGVPYLEQCLRNRLFTTAAGT
ncbi:tryptophan 2,3-dioxygenase family protein [Saccharopolyspora taberi]|uniref:Tryptophan 2,3-dioxygenase n=1 Tax=Saccharopolyspora taberi TaxID=60895 RepID=A0ABN3VHC5_9PSEU